jgi:DNA polymerase (family 10)
MKNRDIARILDRIGDVLEFKGENVFKVNAYRRAARALEDLAEDVQAIKEQGRLRQIPGIGSGMAEKVEEYLSTGKIGKHEELTKDLPPRLMDLLKIPGLGPKTLQLAYERLGVRDLEDLKRVIADGNLAGLPGMGAKKVENIQKGIEHLMGSRQRIPLGVAYPLVQTIVGELEKIAGVSRVSAAGSLRRMRETIGDIDILATGKKGAVIIEEFCQLPLVERILAQGDTKGSVIVEGGTQVDLRVVEEAAYGAALQYFTGSKDHNIKLREMAKAGGLKISEYGVFKGQRKLSGKTEEEVYKVLGLPLIPPELREDRGEIEAGLKGDLPELVEAKKILGDLHVHSEFSDGASTLEEIAAEGKDLGYKYVAICDHSRSVKYAGGLSADRLERQGEEIRRLNSKLKGIQLLAGSEVDIKGDGSLDFPDRLLEKLDIVLAAIHQGFKQRVTERMCKAMENPHVDVIVHPTGRLISRREGYEVDLEAVLKKAAETRTALEINAYYDRLDLNDMNCLRAGKLGVKVAIGTDAHHSNQMWMLQLGVGVARRGWLEAKDVVNTLPAGRVGKWKSG